MNEPMVSITLRALEGEPLADEKIRDLVIATAHSIAERNLVGLDAVRADTRSITLDLRVSRLAALGFAAELRRLTDTWFRRKTGRSLWGEPNIPGEDWEI